MARLFKQVIHSRRPLTGKELDRLSDRLATHGFAFRQINAWLIDNHGLAFYECDDCFGLEPRLRMPDGSDIVASRPHQHLQGIELMFNRSMISQFLELLDPRRTPATRQSSSLKRQGPRRSGALSRTARFPQ
jgi:hypothetical protein